MTELNMEFHPLTLSMINAVRNSIGMNFDGLDDMLGKENDIEPIDLQMITKQISYVNNLREVLRLLLAGDIRAVMCNSILSACFNEAIEMSFDMEH
jgi:hypothetical protein